jgi:quinol-cytochrome oxidoreductase complex cytochrome b subunit
LGFLGFLYCWSVFFNPDYFGHPDNYLKADPLSTPRHISPEWYFLPFYAILRAVPNKVGGVACMFSAILILFILPILAPFEKNLAQHDKIWSFFNLLFLHNVILLGYLGGQNVLQPYT